MEGEIQQCMFVSTTSQNTELLSHLEKLWQLDTLPYRSQKVVTRSQRDQEALELLQAQTVRVNVEGILRYATPLLHVNNMPTFRVPPDAVLGSLRSMERHLMKHLQRAAAYREEIDKLEKAVAIKKIPKEKVGNSLESWFIPHHLVTHNQKNHIVFSCSFTYRNQNLNELLLTGPNLGATLLGVLLRFREHSIVVSSDIRGMFHQVRLLAKDHPLLCFLWRDLQRDLLPSI